MQQGLLSLTNIESISCCQRVDIGDRPARRHAMWNGPKSLADSTKSIRMHHQTIQHVWPLSIPAFLRRGHSLHGLKLAILPDTHKQFPKSYSKWRRVVDNLT